MDENFTTGDWIPHAEERLIEIIASTAEAMSLNITGAGLALMARDLAEYPLADVQCALSRLRREETRLTLKGIMDRLPNGWPGPEEAWATFPKSEADTGIVTESALRAWGVCVELWESGDKVAARMAFREAYARLVSEERETATRPKWVPSIGTDRASREGPLMKAVAEGKIRKKVALCYLPTPSGCQNCQKNQGGKCLTGVSGYPDMQMETCRYFSRTSSDDAGPVVALLTGKVSHIPQSAKTKARLAELRRAINSEKGKGAA